MAWSAGMTVLAKDLHSWTSEVAGPFSLIVTPMHAETGRPPQRLRQTFGTEIRHLCYELSKELQASLCLSKDRAGAHFSPKFRKHRSRPQYQGCLGVVRTVVGLESREIASRRIGHPEPEPAVQVADYPQLLTTDLLWGQCWAAQIRCHPAPSVTKADK